MIWLAAAAGALIVLALAAYWAPARVTILVDTPTSTARADLKLLWGLGPKYTARALPRAQSGSPLAVFNDALRIGNALMTPGLADVTVTAVRQLFESKLRTANIGLMVNTGDTAKDLVIQTAAQAAITMAPAKIAQSFTFGKAAVPGAEFNAKFELMASPSRLQSIWSRLKSSKPAREFGRRLRRKPKAEKKPVREVRAS